MKRLRLYDIRTGRLPELLQMCQSDVARLAEFVNAAQQRLIYAKEAGETGWWGTWAEMAFNIPKASPYLTTPRSVARLETLVMCDQPVPLNNQFYEYLRFGNGRMPKECQSQCPRERQVFTRNNAVSFTDMTNAPQLIRVYLTDPQDVGKRVLIQGADENFVTVFTQDNANRVQGVFLTLDSPFVTTPFSFQTLTGIQKDITAGEINIYQADPLTGEEVLLLTMEPGEETAYYRRYYFDNMPSRCCATVNADTIQVRAIVKLELLPVVTDTDYCLIQNKEALIEEAMSVHYSQVDSSSAKMMAQEKHQQAIRLLNGELNHYVGQESVAINFAPFGDADLRRVNIGMI
jgi:hypothetical protein